MQDVLKLYCDNVLKPIETERNKILYKVYNKNIFDILYRKHYRKMLEKYDELYFDALRKFEKFMEED